MAQKTDRKTDRDRQGGGRKRAQTGPIKRKSCFFCKDKVEEIDYKNVNQLRRYISEKGKIRNRRITGACRRHQRQVAVAVKRARDGAAAVRHGLDAPPGHTWRRPRRDHTARFGVLSRSRSFGYGCSLRP